jgi:hypothetical protein
MPYGLSPERRRMARLAERAEIGLFRLCKTGKPPGKTAVDRATYQALLEFDIISEDGVYAGKIHVYVSESLG